MCPTSTSYRQRVLDVIEAAHEPLTGRAVAQLAGITHLQACFALNALLNREQVERVGRKFTARWTRRTPPTFDAFAALDAAMKGFHG